MKSIFSLRHLFAAAAVLGALGVAGCNQSSLSPISDDYFDKTMTKHYQDGDMNTYDYQQSLKVFPAPDASTDKTTGPITGDTTASPSGKTPDTATPDNLSPASMK